MQCTPATLDIKGACAYLGMSKATLFRRMGEGKLRSYQTGSGRTSARRFDVADLDAYKERQKDQANWRVDN
jgi:excisionase family DNA binding protein